MVSEGLFSTGVSWVVIIADIYWVIPMLGTILSALCTLACFTAFSNSEWKLYFLYYTDEETEAQIS